MSYNCELVGELSRLKKSALEAIDSEKEFSDFKQYMHIHRKVESDLINTIEYAKCLPGKCLLLLCGNVGDGKSHLISYLKHHKMRYLDGFDIHNDATESFDRYKDEKQTLAEVLREFSDDRIDEPGIRKNIVAINMGVLSNFLDSEQGKNFTALAKYVEDNKILTSTDIGKVSDNNNIFFHVNFGDYHIYRLNDGKIDSPYISELMDKVFSKSPDSPFYNAYNYSCSLCLYSENCPVKCNYEMLGNPRIKEGVISVITEAIVKDKIILSTRDLLNFFYYICVFPEFSEKFLKNSKDSFSDYLNYTIPNMLYGHDDVSVLLRHINRYDYLCHRSEDFDNLITRFNTVEKVSDIIDEYLEDSSCKKYILKNKEQYDGVFSKRDAVFKYLCRLIRISGKDGLGEVDEDFVEFISYVYSVARNDTKLLQTVYKMVKRCIYAWNGSTDTSHIILPTSNVEYMFSTNIEVKFRPNYAAVNGASPCDETIIDKFTPNFTLTFGQGDTSQTASISIDYDLYKMLKKVANGYRPTAQDKNHFAGFDSFVKKLVYSNKNDIVILHYSHDEIEKYQLEYNEFGSYEFREV